MRWCCHGAGIRLYESCGAGASLGQQHMNTGLGFFCDHRWNAVQRALSGKQSVLSACTSSYAGAGSVCHAQLKAMLTGSPNHFCLSAQVASIRDATARTLQKIAQEFGGDWAKEHLVPQVRRAYLHSLLAKR